MPCPKCGFATSETKAMSMSTRNELQKKAREVFIKIVLLYERSIRTVLSTHGKTLMSFVLV